VPGLAGGYVGVDVFFVISGFLITGLLLGDIGKYARVRFLHFYARRAQRILPAATVVIVATVVASIFLLNVVQARATMVDSVWAVFFGANIHFAHIGTDYFTAGTATSPLQHYWTLAVEEQFYLVWPAILGLIAWMFSKRGGVHVPRLAISVTLLVIGGVSFYLSVTQTASNPSGAYFSTMDRAWELAVGAMLAVAVPWLSWVPGLIRSLASWCGLVAVLVAAIVYNAHTAFPGDKALLPVLGCAALLVGGVGQPSMGAHSLLSLRPLRFLGDISYSLYLWHWPILILGAAYLGSRDTMMVRLGLVVASVLMATISYYGFENPLRHARLLAAEAWRGLLLWPLATGIVVALALFAAPASPFAAANGPANPLVSPLQAVRNAVVAGQHGAPVPTATDPSLLSAQSDHVNLGSCSQYPTFTGRLCQLGDPEGTKTLVLFGNSHSVMWEPALAAIAKSDHWKFYAVVREACGYDMYSGVVPGEHNNLCAQFYSWAKVQIAALHPSVLVIGSYTMRRHWRLGETRVIAQLKPDTSRLILLSDIPEAQIPSVCLLRTGANQGDCLSRESKVATTDQVAVAALARASRVQYLDVTSLRCDAGLCPAVINGLVPTWSVAHLTPQYSAYLAPALAASIDLTGANTVPIVPVPLPVNGVR
jgi:peptidoglycan/LPS O-acetylase OafA/YrhL